MRAFWNNAVIAETMDGCVVIEDNCYFPPDTVNKEYLVPSDHTTECPWKGTARYYHVYANGKQNDNAAWYYPEPKEEAVERVGKDFSNHVAFWNGVEIVE